MTTRLSIYQQITSQLIALDMIGLVIEPGDWNTSAAEVISDPTDPKHVAELAFGDDRVIGTPSNVIDKKFQVAVMVHLSPALSEDDGSSYMAQAEAAYKAIEALYGGYGPDDGTWGGFAIKTVDDGGGGLSIESSSHNIVTVVYFDVQYRHRPGEL